MGTLQNSDGHPDLSMIYKACESLGGSLRDNGGEKDSDDYHVVVVKSTIPPGTSEQLG